MSLPAVSDKLRDAHFDPDREPHRLVAWMVGVIALFFFTLVVWANWARLDVAVSAQGAVVPPSRLQEVQSLEGGIVEELLVRPGQPVRKGQVLARLDRAPYNAGLGENRNNQLGALAGLARTDALLSGTAPRFDPAWRADAPGLIERETELWRDALRAYQSAMTAAREGVERHQAEIHETQARIQMLQTSLKLAQESLAIEERLMREGAGARADYLQAQQRLVGQQNEIETLRKSLPRLQATLAEAQAAERETDARLRAQWGAQRSELRTKAAALGSLQDNYRDKVARRELLSPVDGVVNRVLVPTLGGVAQPGKAILEVVPNEAALTMTLRVRPTDIGFIHPGQKARVRVLAYDSAIYGQMHAQVSRVGADAVVDEKGNAYFEVQLEAQPGQLHAHGQPLSVTPGMPVDAGVLTGERTVMQYLLKPVLRGLQAALQER